MGKKNAKHETASFLRKTISLVLELLLIGLMIYSGIKIYTWWKENNSNKELLKQISNNSKIAIETGEGEQDYIIDFNQLKQVNTDVVAWIDVKGTDIDFPVVRAKDNDYYLTHSIDKSYNSAGWIFMDCANKLDGSDKNIIIYGHNRKDSSMFGTLKNILKEEWYNNNDNRILKFVTENEESKYEVFSVYKVQVEDYYRNTSFTDKEFESFIKTIKNRSIKDFGVDVTKDDTILTLSTCADNNSYRIVLHAKKIT